MMLNSNAEKAALEAQQLKPFEDLNLSGVKTKIDETLGLIGRSGIFAEYTLHDIGHVDKMLASLDWLIPEDTQRVMTPADWLLVVLGIYTHDLGMLVTEREYAARGESSFPEFCQQELFMGDAGTDYKSKVAELGNHRERFLYQEYVRHHHAQRSADWIAGKVNPRLGITNDAAEVVADALRSLPSQFRSDLSLVAASHHLSDLYDTSKYLTSQPYGDSDAATANVQFAGLVLRVSDLLHITSDRTPSTMYRLINPRDPVSQTEWAKQASVTRVRSQKGRTEDGQFSDTAPRDTIEVFAAYKEADAFFGLTSYLAYASSEVKLAQEWAETSAQQFGGSHRLPWKKIDTSQVKAEGFSPSQLEFSLDQAKILELLTGHTLYNDTSVVIRELVQNSLDAVRLQAHIEPADASNGEVIVEWDEAERELVIKDNGIGMTRSVIERNLLKAGASRYQEEQFQEQHPSFSPISRFGIGVLSAFMIADSMSITTVSVDERFGHQITLRSVHGKYLLRLLDRAEDRTVRSIGHHGTEIRLKVRKSADLDDVTDILHRWIVVPGCTVLSKQDGEDLEKIGFDSPGEALETMLERADIKLCGDVKNPADRSVRVIQYSYDSVQTAFAVRWNRYFRQWALLPTSAVGIPVNTVQRAVGTCIEGIRVEESSAGFKDVGLIALSNARGHGAPKTNVARVGIEATTERREMLRRVYRAYFSHIAAECNALHKERGLSMTWAAQEAELLCESILTASDSPVTRRRSVNPVDRLALKEEIRRQPLFLVEDNGERKLKPAEELVAFDRLWTIDSGLIRAAEGILREVPSDGSLHALASGFETDVFRLPGGVTLVGYRPVSSLYAEVLGDREVGALIISHEDRRVDLGWDRPTSDACWTSVLSVTDAESDRTTRHGVPLYVLPEQLSIGGRRGESAVRAHNVFYIFGDTPIGRWLLSRIRFIREHKAADLMSSVISRNLARRDQSDDLERIVISDLKNRFSVGLDDLGRLDLDPTGLIQALDETPPKVFDTWAWRRTGMEELA